MNEKITKEQFPILELTYSLPNDEFIEENIKFFETFCIKSYYYTLKNRIKYSKRYDLNINQIIIDSKNFKISPLLKDFLDEILNENPTDFSFFIEELNVD